jgi:hypothetical protein
MSLNGGSMKRTKEQTRKYNQTDYEKNKEKRKEAARQYYYDNKEKVLENVHEYREKNRAVIQEKGRKYYRRNIENRLLNAARSRSKKYGYAFDIEVTDIHVPSHCPLLGIELYIAEGRKTAKDNSPSLDRIDSTKGYTKDNVWVISHRANTIKSNATLEEIELLVMNWRKINDSK